MPGGPNCDQCDSGMPRDRLESDKSDGEGVLVVAPSQFCAKRRSTKKRFLDLDYGLESDKSDGGGVLVVAPSQFSAKRRSTKECFLDLDSDDCFIYLMSLLPLRSFIMFLRTCKWFLLSKDLSFIHSIANSCLSMSFPSGPRMTGLYNPSIFSLLEVKHLFTEFFWNTSMSSHLFSKHGLGVLKAWITTSAQSRFEQINLPFDLTVLRKGGFFSSFCARFRFAEILKSLIDDELGFMMYWCNGDHDFPPEAAYSFSQEHVGLILRLEFLYELCTSSFAVSQFQIYSSSWCDIAMHDSKSLLQVDMQWHVDICEHHVKEIEEKFRNVIRAPTINNLRSVFTRLQSDMQLTWIWEALVLTDCDPSEMFPCYQFEMNPGFMSREWHESPYRLHPGNLYDMSISRGVYDDQFWNMFLKLCSRSSNWGVFNPDNNFYFDVGLSWVEVVYRELESERQSRAQ
jgi:hypothetical protein